MSDDIRVPNRKRATTRKKQKNRSKHSLIKFIIGMLIISVALGIMTGFAYLDIWGRDLPVITSSSLYKKMSTKVYDSSGNLVDTIGFAQQKWVPYEEISPNFINALIATEDSDFFNHNGVNWKRFAAAALKGGDSGGASTLTMQLAKLNYLEYDIPTPITCPKEGAPTKNTDGTLATTRSDYGTLVPNMYIEMTTDSLGNNACTYNETLKNINPLKYKIQQIQLALEIESKYSKKDILEIYSNTVLFGNSVYGVEAASQYYFGTSAKDLTIEQAVLLAGMPQTPTKTNPYNKNGMDELTTRRKTVLALMVRHKKLSQSEADKIASVPVANLILDTEPKTQMKQQNFGFYEGIYWQLYDFFTEISGEPAYENFSTANFQNDGYEITTTIDQNVQNTITDVAKTPARQATALGDIVYNADDKFNVAISVIDPFTGYVKGLVGSRTNTEIFSENNGVKLQNHPGSTMKPIFAYAPAIEYLGYGEGTRVDASNKGFSPPLKNYGDAKYGTISMAESLQKSTNTGAARVAEDVGYERAAAFSNQFNFKDEVTPNRSSALGAWGNIENKDGEGATPVEMAAAYSAFANGGTYNEPTFILTVKIPENSPYYTYFRDTGGVVDFTTSENRTLNKRVMKESTAFIISDMLDIEKPNSLFRSEVYPHGLGKYRISAKSGSSTYDKNSELGQHQATKDHWAVGFSKEYAIATWAGYSDKDQSYSKGYYLDYNPLYGYNRGHSYASYYTFTEAFERLAGTKSSEEFTPPSSVVRTGGGYYPSGSKQVERSRNYSNSNNDSSFSNDNNSQHDNNDDSDNNDDTITVTTP